MKRFMGMMPSEEIKRAGVFEDTHGWKIHIDAGPNGWTIRYADGSSQWKDNVATTEENYKEAEATLKAKMPDVRQIHGNPVKVGEGFSGESMGEC